MEKIYNLFLEITKNNTFVKGVFSNPIDKTEVTKINFKPLLLKNIYSIQFEEFLNKKAFHKNLTLDEAIKYFNEQLEKFKQLFIVTQENEYQILKNKKGFSIKSKKIENKIISLEHNNKKNYILEEHTNIPFLIELGVMNSDGIVLKEKFNKFRQINRYLEFIEDTIKDLKDRDLISNSIKIVDFGCGKSYLTFALYHYLTNIKKISVEIIGLDLKDDVIKHCNSIAKNLNFTNLKFLKGDIANFKEFSSVDIIFSLHACNTATDYSILKGLELNAKAILAVPCCQSEINQKISKTKDTPFKNSLTPFSNFGLFQERFSSLATDALRALSLERCGFNVKVIEFIDMEHTPKNILIKAIKENSISSKKIKEKQLEYNHYINFLGIKPLLGELLEKYML